MAKHFEVCDDMPILAAEKEGINNNKPFVLLRFKDNSGKIGFKVSYADFNIDTVKQYYYKLKDIIKEPLLIVNDYLNNIINDKDIQKAIYSFYYEKIKIVEYKHLNIN